MRRDVGMIQRGERLRFALEPRDPLGIGREQLGQDLDRDVAIELRVARAVDLAHPARAEGGENLVRSEASAGRKRHELFGEETSGLYRRNRALPVLSRRCYVVPRNECTGLASRSQRDPRDRRFRQPDRDGPGRPGCRRKHA